MYALIDRAPNTDCAHVRWGPRIAGESALCWERTLQSAAHKIILQRTGNQCKTIATFWHDFLSSVHATGSNFLRGAMPVSKIVRVSLFSRTPLLPSEFVRLSLGRSRHGALLCALRRGLFFGRLRRAVATGLLLLGFTVMRRRKLAFFPRLVAGLCSRAGNKLQ